MRISKFRKIRWLKGMGTRSLGAFGFVSLLGIALAAEGGFWNSAVWTDWHRQALLQSMVGLAKIRAQLEAENLTDAYSRPRASEVCPLASSCYPVTCGAFEARYRRNDGACNHFDNPAMGSAGSRFSRNLKDTSILPDLIARERGGGIVSPNPLEISRRLLSRDLRLAQDQEYDAAPVNLLAAAWIQFQSHDWFNHGNEFSPAKMKVARPWTVTDLGAGPTDLRKLILPRTLDDNTAGRDRLDYATFRNETTHWWDGSQIYGHTPEQADCSGVRAGRARPATLLRECVGGRLALTGEGLLPIDPRLGKERTGFNRNWWVGLSVFHTLFARNHNRIATQLAKAYPTFDDEKLFQISRLVNAAVIAKIHTIEWTPGILGHPVLNIGMHTNWYGFAQGVRKLVAEDVLNREVPLGTLTRAERLICPSGASADGAGGADFRKRYCAYIQGMVGGRTELHGHEYSLTEEFVSVYRLHSLLPENLRVFGPRGMEAVPMVQTREKFASAVIAKYGIDSTARSLGVQPAASLTLGNFPRFLRNITVPVEPAGIPLGSIQLDLAAVDLMRDRERGVPRYNEFRRQLNLKPIRTFEDLMPQRAVDFAPLDPKLPFAQAERMAARNRELTGRLRQIYGDVERIDLQVGTLAEGYRPQGYGFGETLFQVFVLMASRRLQADRFFAEAFNEQTYTKVGMRIVNESTLKQVLLDNFDSLDPARIPRNAFAPWR